LGRIAIVAKKTKPSNPNAFAYQMAIFPSLAILTTASPKVSPFAVAFNRETFEHAGGYDIRHSKRARHLLAASELTFIRSILSWECWLGFFIGFHNWLETEIRNNDSNTHCSNGCCIKV
jgi:hypothetical protein